MIPRQIISTLALLRQNILKIILNDCFYSSQTNNIYKLCLDFDPALTRKGVKNK